jgi:hypothetical protein
MRRRPLPLQAFAARPARVFGGVVLSLGAAACFDEPTFDAPAETSGEVFFDGFSEGLDFQAFAGTNQANPAANALAVDDVEYFSGRSSLRFIVPGLNDPTGGFAGGALVTASPRDLSGFNAFTFMAKGSRAATLNVVGFGNDNTGTSRFTVERTDVPITGDWTKVVVPLPDPARLTSERGLFHFAEGADGEPPTGYTFWLDELQFVRLPDEELGTALPAVDTTPLALEVDGSATLEGLQARFSARPETEVTSVAPAWFDFSSDDAAVATVDADGVVRGVSPGAAVVSVSLAGALAGAIDVEVAAAVRPVDLPPAPTAAAADVISLFSDAYAAAPVDTFRADWSVCGEVKDVAVVGDTVKSYASLDYAGIEFISTPLDLTAYRALHIDVWTPDSEVVKVKLVDFGPDGVFGNDDSEHELTFTSTSNPPLTQSTWVPLELPLTSFVGLRRRNTVTQLVLSASTSTLFVDNVYFVR